MLPWIDEKKLEQDADKIVPLLQGFLAFVPGTAGAVPTLAGLKVLIDNDALRGELANLINRATGAQPPP